ncbi:MAG: ATP-binding cassette domain-containing protein [Bdellovibrionota bacterium]
MSSKKDASMEIEGISSALELGPYLDKKILHCSGGIKQRTHIAVTLLSSSPLLVLDEPFNNIDPDSRILIVKALKNYLREKNATLLISSHQFEAMDDLWTHLIFIKNGSMVDFFEKSSVHNKQRLQEIFFELKELSQ